MYARLLMAIVCDSLDIDVVVIVIYRLFCIKLLRPLDTIHVFHI